YNTPIPVPTHTPTPTPTPTPVYSPTPTPTSPFLVCYPGFRSVVQGQPVTYTVTGGSGLFGWSPPEGSPVAGFNNTFTTSYYNTSGVKIVTVYDRLNPSNFTQCSAYVSPSV